MDSRQTNTENWHLVCRYCEDVRFGIVNELFSQGLAVKLDSEYEERRGKLYLEAASKCSFKENG